MSVKARLWECPACHRKGVNQVGVSDTLSCFHDHDSADVETVAMLEGPLALLALRVNNSHSLATDEEYQGQVGGHRAVLEMFAEDATTGLDSLAAYAREQAA